MTLESCRAAERGGLRQRQDVGQRFETAMQRLLQ